MELGEQNLYNEFGHWFHNILDGETIGLKDLFINGSVPQRATFDEIWQSLDVPEPSTSNDTVPRQQVFAHWPHQEAAALFSHLPFELDQSCVSDKNKWWYRTYDGSCNWLKNGERSEGQYGMAKSRDYGQHAYADGISKPREGPNPRAVSNAFFKRKETLYYEHTPLLLGLIEFVIHDLSWSADSETEFIDVLVPDDEEHFAQNTTLRVARTEPYPGTGTSRANPRENINRATTWLDLSSLYGSTADVANKLRSFKKGKLLTQEVKARGSKRVGSYLPFNSMGVPTRTRPGVSMNALFAGGDPRTNEDWVMLGVHTLLLREHNRLCDILAERQPEYGDEELYQSVRLLMSAKFSLIANAYQMAYFKDMDWPSDDGFPLYREMLGRNWLEINPANNYPWPLATKNGKPTVVSAEMAIVYRFHEFIINSFPVKDALNDTIWDQRLFDTAFNSTGFIDAGLENILRGSTSTSIPNFKSGVDEDFRSAGKYRGRPFDIVVSSIVHEREQGLPTFNDYFRAYNKQGPKVQISIRKTFEEFSSDPVMVSELKRLYKSPDEVDLVVGCQLDETMFPHSSVPASALIVSLFNLISVGNSDRFSIGFAAMRCLLVDKPWDCHPSNALEELLWKPAPKDRFPNFRVYDSFWMTELDFQAHGKNLLWRLVTENSEINCLQRNPLFPVDHETNPILCDLPKSGIDIKVILSTGIEVGRSLFLTNYVKIAIAALAGLAGFFFLKTLQGRANGYPPVLHGWPVLGKGLQFQRDSRSVILEGVKKYGTGKSGVFGIQLASLTHYLITQPNDMQMLIDDAPYDVQFSLEKFFEAINIPNILGKENFTADLHTKLIRTHLTDPDTVRELGRTVQFATNHFLDNHPLLPKDSSSQRYEALSVYLGRLISGVSARCMLGADAHDHPEIIDIFLQFNNDVDNIMGLGSLLPSFLRFISHIPMKRSYRKFQKVFLPIIRKHRQSPDLGQDGLLYFLPFILDIVQDDNKASDLLVIIVWIGLRNLQMTLTSTLLDMINEPGLVPKVTHSLSGATIENLDTFDPGSKKDTPWALLRSAMFESIRLCGTTTGPARVISAKHGVPLVSDPSVRLPPNQVATLSALLTHRLPENWGPDASEYRAERFLAQGPDIGSTKFITWGLKGPHSCPGRWFAQESICIMMKALLDKYTFEAEQTGLRDGDKYAYSVGVVTRKESPVLVTRRDG